MLWLCVGLAGVLWFSTEPQEGGQCPRCSGVLGSDADCTRVMETASGQALLGLAWDGTPFLQRLCGLELQMLSMLRQRQEALGQLRAVLQKERMATLRRLQESLEKVRGGVGAWGVGGLVPEIPWVTLCVDCR